MTSGNLAFRPGSVSPPAREAEEMMLLNSIGSAIERAMIAAHMTHETLAERMGISRGYLSLIISGKRIANVQHVLKCVKVTGSMAPAQWMNRAVLDAVQQRAQAELGGRAT